MWLPTMRTSAAGSGAARVELRLKASSRAQQALIQIQRGVAVFCMKGDKFMRAHVYPLDAVRFFAAL